MAVRMELSRILIRELNDYQIIELREASDADAVNGSDAPDGSDGDPGEGTPSDPASKTNGQTQARTFPIVIGLPEAQAIERRLKGITIKRPQTHELLANVITQLGGTLKSITINDLKEHTFFATLDVIHDDALMHIDARPSDAIALGVAENVPIYVAEHVLDAASADAGEEPS